MEPNQRRAERRVEVGGRELRRPTAGHTLPDLKRAGEGVKVVDDDVIGQRVSGVVNKMDERSSEHPRGRGGSTFDDEGLRRFVIRQSPSLLWGRGGGNPDPPVSKQRSS